jgi:hypothetical protein
MKRYVLAMLKGLLCYCIAGAALLMYHSWSNWDGHAHVPFSGFPEFLIFSPIAPYFLGSGSENWLNEFLVFFVTLAVLLLLVFGLPKFIGRKGGA